MAQRVLSQLKETEQTKEIEQELRGSVILQGESMISVSDVMAGCQSFFPLGVPWNVRVLPANKFQIESSIEWKEKIEKEERVKVGLHWMRVVKREDDTDLDPRAMRKQIWIRIYGAPYGWFAWPAINQLVKFGDIVDLDKMTATRKDLRWARVLVDMKATAGVPAEHTFELLRDAGKKEMVDLRYEIETEEVIRSNPPLEWSLQDYAEACGRLEKALSAQKTPSQVLTAPPGFENQQLSGHMGPTPTGPGGMNQSGTTFSGPGGISQSGTMFTGSGGSNSFAGNINQVPNHTMNPQFSPNLGFQFPGSSFFPPFPVQPSYFTGINGCYPQMYNSGFGLHGQNGNGGFNQGNAVNLNDKKGGRGNKNKKKFPNKHWTKSQSKDKSGGSKNRNIATEVNDSSKAGELNKEKGAAEAGSDRESEVGELEELRAANKALVSQLRWEKEKNQAPPNIAEITEGISPHLLANFFPLNSLKDAQIVDLFEDLGISVGVDKQSSLETINAIKHLESNRMLNILGGISYTIKTQNTFSVLSDLNNSND